jgi:hypothetical protein
MFLSLWKIHFRRGTEPFTAPRINQFLHLTQTPKGIKQ